ncbi:MAG: hypothetical protein M1832_002213 [Thelocarpon impressellum]|nr:MAG: hypothetical protein M1832_002213 [Thelocarpon impressellum]
MSTKSLLTARDRLTESLAASPYDVVAYLRRAAVYGELGYHDLAAGDAYRALLLADEVADDSGEYHERAEEALKEYVERDEARRVANGDGLQRALDDKTREAYAILVGSLARSGCLKHALEFYNRGVAAYAGAEEIRCLKDELLEKAREVLHQSDLSLSDLDIRDLPEHGWARREVYPWNTHEPDRFSQQSLDVLNAEMARVAPKCEVRVTELPTLRKNNSTRVPGERIRTNRQLGVFATADIAPGEVFLREPSILTANNRLHENLCDACSSAFVPSDPAVATCPDCDDIFFCSSACLARAAAYHPSVCGKDGVETVGKDVPGKESPHALYLLLLARALAMSFTTDTHPLELEEVRYIWGDFLPVGADPALPFSFSHSIAQPLHVLEKMDVDIYASLESTEPWVLNTLAAKFRGTASARLSTRDGRPEVCAVHPLWCLANHSCAPNVRWEWGGEMAYWARETRVLGDGQGGIKKGEEVLNHYCDVELDVAQRRAWMMGTLGGVCMCARCVEEEGGGEGVGRGVEAR